MSSLIERLAKALHPFVITNSSEEAVQISVRSKDITKAREVLEEFRVAQLDLSARKLPDIPGLASDPSAFVRWADPAGYDMTSHSLHFLFTDERTSAARAGWNACRHHYGIAEGFNVGADKSGSASIPLQADDVKWIVNDSAELGVMIHGQAFFLYKGDSLVYESGTHDNGKQMYYRPVFKREFGECAHPINHADPTRRGTVSRDDSDEWRPLPSLLTGTKTDAAADAKERPAIYLSRKQVVGVLDGTLSDKTSYLPFSRTREGNFTVPVYPDASDAAPTIAQSEIDRVAELTEKAMEGGLRGFMSTWGWQQFARTLIENLRPYGLRVAQEEKPSDSHQQLMSFYGVSTISALVDAQEEHIKRLQAALPEDNQPAVTRVREG